RRAARVDAAAHAVDGEEPDVTTTETDRIHFEALPQWERMPDGMTMHEASGVSVAPDGLVYVLTRNVANPVLVFTPDGEFVRPFGAGVFTGRSHAINAAQDGFIYAVDDDAATVTKWSPAGELLMTIGTPGQPSPKFSGHPFNRPTDVAVAS